MLCYMQFLLYKPTARCLNDAVNTSIGRLSCKPKLASEEAESNERCPVNTERRNYFFI